MKDNFFFLLIFDCITCLMGLFLLRLSSIRLYWLTPVNLFVFFYSLYILLAHFLYTIYLSSGIRIDVLDTLIYKDAKFFEINIYSFLFFLAFCLGVFFAAVLCKRGVSELYGRLSTFNLIKRGDSAFPWLLLLVLFDFFWLSLFFLKFGVPIFSHDVDDARYFAIENGGWQFLLPIFVYTNPFIGCFSLIRFKVYGLKKYKYLLMMTLILQMFSIAAGFRTFIIIYIAMLASVYYVYYEIKLKKLIYVTFAGVGIFIILTIVKNIVNKNDESFLQLVIYKILHRLVFDSYYSVKIIFNIFNNQEFLYGISYWWDLCAKLPGQQITFQTFLSQNIGYTKYFMAIAPTLPGELYANFGYFGVLLSFFFGFMLYILFYYSLVKLKNESCLLLNIVFLSLVSIGALRSVSVGIGGVFFLFFSVMSLFIAISSFSYLTRVAISKDSN